MCGVRESVRVVVVFIVTTIHTALIVIRSAYDISMIMAEFTTLQLILPPRRKASLILCNVYVESMQHAAMEQLCLNTIKGRGTIHWSLRSRLCARYSSQK